MKKIKIMLLSLFILATVGGILAFKAKSIVFCRYEIVDDTCPLIDKPVSLTSDPTGIIKEQYTLPNVNCPSQVVTISCTLSFVDTRYAQ